MNKILVVEDDVILAENIGFFLEKENYIVNIAHNGADALELIKQVIPDLIICDVNMPQMNGYQLKEALNKNKTVDIPLIYLTAKTQISDLREGMSLGADDYIFKPYNSDELIKIIKLRLERRKNLIDNIRFNFSEENKTYEVHDSFLVKGGKKSKLIKIINIKLILADAQYSEVYLSNNEKFIMRVSLNEWELKLPNQLFKRVHRSTIINYDFVDSHYTTGDKYYFKIKNWEESIVISRRKYKLLKLN